MSNEDIVTVIQVLALPTEDRRITLKGTAEQIKKIAHDRAVALGAASSYFEDENGVIVIL